MQSSSTISIEHLQARAQAADDAAKQEFRKKAESYAYDFRFALKEASRLLGVSAGFLRKYAATHKIDFPDPELRTKEEHKAIFKQYEEIRLAKEPKRVEPRKPAVQPGHLKLSPQLDKLSKRTLWERHNQFLERVQELAETMTMKEVSKVVNVSLRFLKNLAYEHDIAFITSQCRTRKAVASAVAHVLDVVAVGELVGDGQAEPLKVVAEVVQAKVDVQPVAVAVPVVAGRVIGTLPAPAALRKQKPRIEQTLPSSAGAAVIEPLERIETGAAQVEGAPGAAQTAEAQLTLPLVANAPGLVTSNARRASEPSCPADSIAMFRVEPGFRLKDADHAPGAEVLSSERIDGLPISALRPRPAADQDNFAAGCWSPQQLHLHSLSTSTDRRRRPRLSGRSTPSGGPVFCRTLGKHVAPPPKRKREVSAIGGLSPPAKLCG